MTKTANAFLRTFISLAGVLFATVLIANAQANSQAAATPSASSTSTPGASPVLPPNAQASPSIPDHSPKVVGIEGHLELDNIVSVEVDNFTEWAATHDATKLVPFLNGRAIRGNYPEEIHPDKSRLHFHLEITPETREVWTDLLGETRGMRRPVTFSIGLENQSPFDSVYGASNPVLLTIISPVYGAISLLVVLFTLILFLW